MPYKLNMKGNKELLKRRIKLVWKRLNAAIRSGNNEPREAGTRLEIY
jgi:hypothetical protein